MKKCILLLSWLLCFMPLSSIAGVGLSPVAPEISDNSDGNLCNLPAPGNFQVTSASSSSVTMAWNTVFGATAYLVIAVDHVTQYVLDYEIVTTTNATLYPTPGSSVDLRVFPF